MGHTRFNKFIQYNTGTPQVPVATSVSGTSTYTSAITDINQMHNIGLDVRYAGTMTGTLSVTCSNDGVVFTPLSFPTPPTQPSGTDLNILINLNQIPWQYIQLSYTNASGSGTIISYMTSKDLD